MVYAILNGGLRSEIILSLTYNNSTKTGEPREHWTRMLSDTKSNHWRITHRNHRQNAFTFFFLNKNE